MVAGASAALMSSSGVARPTTTDALVPRRAFGRTGVKISQLCLGGGSFLSTDSQALLDDALKCGVNCWEIVSFTGNAYSDYFKTHPGIRERVFLSGKVRSTDPPVMQEQLDKLLADNETPAIDFLAIHTIDDISLLNDDVRKWAKKVKKERKIRFFGFCTHRNMDSCLSAAADLGWIDGIQTVYSYRLRSVKSMEDALQRCHEKGIGIFAIKSMGLSVQRKTELQKLPLNEEKMNSLLAGHDLSFEQAKLKAIWQNPNVSSVCSLMPSSEILHSNVSAAMDPRPLSAEISQLLADHADSTGRHFCRRCGTCDGLSADKIPIFDIMETLMYSRAYGWREWAVERFAHVPSEIRGKMDGSDYSMAEEKCPQKMPIAELMKGALAELNS